MLLLLILLQLAASAANWWTVQPTGFDSTLRGDGLGRVVIDELIGFEQDWRLLGCAGRG